MKKRFSLGGLLATVAVVAAFVGGPAAEVASAHSCTPGYFKNHLSVTNALLTKAGYTSTTTLEDVFNVPDQLGLDNVTIIDALSLQGGSTLSAKAEILFRAAASSLLNGIAEPNWPGPSTAQPDRQRELHPVDARQEPLHGLRERAGCAEQRGALLAQLSGDPSR